MFYDYNHNVFLLIIFICNIISLISLILIIIFYIFGKGSKYLIQSLYFIQALILLMFFIPQTIGPFFYSKDADESLDFSYCFISEDNGINENEQNCMTDGYCKFQGITNNGAWFASALFSFLSCRLIQGVIGERRTITIEIKKYLIYIVFLIIICNIGSCFANFKHYGIKYEEETIYYICNLKLVTDSPWIFWWIFQLTINACVFVLGLLYYWHIQKSIQQLQIRLQENLTSVKTLKIQALHIIVIIFWTVNILIKLMEEYALNELNWIPLQIILFLFMFPVQLLGFFYAEFYFYSFQDHLRHNLPPNLKTLFNILVRINVVTLYFSFERAIDQYSDDRKSSIQSNEASLLYHHNEISAN